MDKGWILPSDFDRECKDVAEFDCVPTGYSDTSTICPLNVKRDGKSDVMFHLENFLAAVRGEALVPPVAGAFRVKFNARLWNE